MRYDGVVFGSEWIRLQLSEQLQRYTDGEAQRLIEFCTGLGAGLGAAGVHRAVAHSAFKRGGFFLVRNHQGQQWAIRLPGLKDLKVDSNEEMAKLALWWQTSRKKVRPAGLYLLPSNPNFAAVDAALVLDAASPATPPANAPTTGGKALVLGVQIATNLNHSAYRQVLARINHQGWERFSSATGSQTLAFAVPFSSWATYPMQKFDRDPAKPAQQMRCDQLVITWVPATAGELSGLTLDGLRHVGKAYSIKDASTLPRAALVKWLLAAEVPTTSYSVFEAALQKVCTPSTPPQPRAQAAAAATEPSTKPEPAADASDWVASAGGLPIVNGQVQQAFSPKQQFSKALVRSWSAGELKAQCKQFGVPMKGKDGRMLPKEQLQERFIAQLSI